MTEDRLRKFAKAMRHDPTDAEYGLWQLLRARRLGGMKFKRQEPLGPYICDFVCHEQKLIVEADGYFEMKGYRTLRFWNEDIQENIDGVAEQIIQATAGR